jgi:hypothetical protein
VDATPQAIGYLSEKGFDPQLGARPVKRVIQRDVLNSCPKKFEWHNRQLFILLIPLMESWSSEIGPN